MLWYSNTDLIGQCLKHYLNVFFFAKTTLFSRMWCWNFLFTFFINQHSFWVHKYLLDYTSSTTILREFQSCRVSVSQHVWACTAASGEMTFSISFEDLIYRFWDGRLSFSSSRYNNITAGHIITSSLSSYF